MCQARRKGDRSAAVVARLLFAVTDAHWAAPMLPCFGSRFRQFHNTCKSLRRFFFGQSLSGAKKLFHSGLPVLEGALVWACFLLLLSLGGKQTRILLFISSNQQRPWTKHFQVGCAAISTAQMARAGAGWPKAGEHAAWKYGFARVSSCFLVVTHKSIRNPLESHASKSH